MERLQYIKRLSAIGREKSLLGYPEDSTFYFTKAVENSNTSEEFLLISHEMYISDLDNNKFLAFSAFLKAIDLAANPFRYFRKSLKRRDITGMVSEFLLKMPDQLFHHLVMKTESQQEVMQLAEIFRPLSNYISDPDPDSYNSGPLKIAS